GSWILQFVGFRGASPPPPDTTPPNVSVSSPGAGANLSGTATLSVNVSDIGLGVSGVQYQIDGITVCIPSVSPPYAITFDTTQPNNGTDTVTAYAWDGARNVGVSSAVTVTINNATHADPTQVGLWSGLQPYPLVSIHMVQVPDGRVVLWDQFATGSPTPY